MTRTDSRHVQRLLSEALQRDPEERAEFLDQACAGQPELRRAVQQLLDERHETETTRTSVDDPPAQRRVVGSYVLGQELGRGGMGVVYLAEDTRLLRRVALKALAPGIARDPLSRERLRREARAAAALSHTGIATVYALEEIGDELFLACEYVPGPPLRRMLQSGPLPLKDVVQTAAQLARALAAAHAHGVVHRDLKPENIIRTPAGVVKILDFGLARMDALVVPRVTQTGAVVGTPAYMSPEQATDRPLDFRTDIFSLGLVIYEMATGTNPFEAKTLSATLSLRLAEFTPPSLAAALPGCPQELDRIVSTCLRRDPLHRYETTEQLADELNRLEITIAPTPSPAAWRPAGPPPPPPESSLWWWQAHLAIVSAVYAATILAAWHVEPWLPDPFGLAFQLALLVVSAAAITLRLHLLFTLRFDIQELAWQQARSRPWIVGCDVLFSIIVLAGAVGLAREHRYWAGLLMAIGVVSVIASLVIEPRTTRSAFRRSRSISGSAMLPSSP